MRRVLLVSLSVVALLVGAGRAQAQSDNGSIIVAEGFSASNAYSGPLPDVFTAWCPQIGIDCVPTVQLEVFDVKKSRRLGTIYAQGREFVQAGATLAFKEFILYDLEGGQLYTLSQDGGHPGARSPTPASFRPRRAWSCWSAVPRARSWAARAVSPMPRAANPRGSRWSPTARTSSTTTSCTSASGR